jgi:Mrp family chromosome partitioning ATPase
MDRIRKALDLARQERDRPFDPEPEETLAQAAKQSTRWPATIQYTKTRMFSPSAGLLESNRIIARPDAARSDPAAAAFRMLRTQVLQRMDENAWRSLALMSPGSEDGKTTTAINLAVSLANDEQHTVLLVDFDLKRPMIARKLGIEARVGTDDILRGAARVEDCLFYPDGFNRLVVLPAVAPMANSSEALAGPRCRELVAELRGRYPERILLFDLPPILSADDALAFVPLVECVLMVIAEGATRREDLLRSMELLRKVPIVGTVLNRATGVPSAYG